MITGIRADVPALAKLIADDVPPFDPTKPDEVGMFAVPASGPSTNTKPDGN